MRFGYRRSVLQKQEKVIFKQIQPQTRRLRANQDEMNRLNHLRELKQPLEYPS